jgi:hypothetical protein
MNAQYKSGDTTNGLMNGELHKSVINALAVPFVESATQNTVKDDDLKLFCDSMEPIYLKGWEEELHPARH